MHRLVDEPTVEREEWFLLLIPGEIEMKTFKGSVVNALGVVKEIEIQAVSKKQAAFLISKDFPYSQIIGVEEKVSVEDYIEMLNREVAQ